MQPSSELMQPTSDRAFARTRAQPCCNAQKGTADRHCCIVSRTVGPQNRQKATERPLTRSHPENNRIRRRKAHVVSTRGAEVDVLVLAAPDAKIVWAPCRTRHPVRCCPCRTCASARIAARNTERTANVGARRMWRQRPSAASSRASSSSARAESRGPEPSAQTHAARAATS